MKTTPIVQSLAVLIFLGSLAAPRAQALQTTPEIEATLQSYFAAMRKRDAAGLKSILAAPFVAVEASDAAANARIIDTADEKKLLPPAGNDDWDDIALSAIQAQASATHPAIAMASFTMTFPLNDERVAALQSALERFPEHEDQAQRKRAERFIADRAIHNQMFAMLGKQGDRWRVICMTFPK